MGLRPSISWVTGTAMTVAGVIGTGILVLPGLAARVAGPASLAAWAAMGVLIVPVALTLGIVASRYPDAGGIASYARRGFGPLAGALTGWLYVGIFPIAAPIAALIGTGYLGAVLPLAPADGYLASAAIIVLSAALHIRGIRLAGWVQSAVVSLIIGVLIFVAISAIPQTSAANLTPFAPHGYRAIGSTMVLLFWAFVGWEMLSHLTEEFRRPRDVMTSIWLTIILVNIIYLAIAWVTVGSGVYRSRGAVSLVGLVERGWGSAAAAVIGVLGLALSFGTIHTYVAGFSRLVYSQALNGDLPAWFGSLHPRYATPHRALAALAVSAGAVLLAGGLLRIDLVSLIRFPSSIFLLLYLVALASAWRLARASGDRKLEWLSGASFALCCIVLPFSGWALVYPAVICLVGFAYRQRSAAHRRG